jgi:nicotinamidase-related amidase
MLVGRLDRRTALLMVDAQQGFSDPAWGLRNNPHAEARMEALLTAWRGMGAPVIHVHHHSPSPDGLLRAGTPAAEPLAFARPGDGEPTYVKTVNSAFIGTTLEADLRRRRIDTLVIVGLTTNHCISTTARMGSNLGFHVLVVADATATFDRLALDGSVRPAAEVHAGALSDLHGEFADVVAARAVLAALERV